MIYVVRHAKVDVAGVCYGQSDVPTTIAAEAAADLVFPQLEGLAIERIATSSTARTRPVAKALARRLGCPLAVDARLAELAMGEWEGRRFADLEIEDAARYAEWMATWRETAPPGGERLADSLARTDAWLREASASRAHVLAVTHAGVIRALRARVTETSYESALAAAVPHLEVEPIRNLR